MNEIKLNRNKSDESLKFKTLNLNNLNTHQMSKSSEELKKKNYNEKKIKKFFFSQEDILNNTLIDFQNEEKTSLSQSNQPFDCLKKNIVFNNNHYLNESLEKKTDLQNKNENSILIKNNMHETYTDFGGINLEEFLFNVLQKNIKDRIHLLKVEQELINLIKDGQRKSHKFPPMSSYHRMLVHRVAAYYGLEHIIDNNGNCVIVIKQNGFTRIPENKFKDQIKDITCDEPKKLILKRDALCLDDYGNDILIDKKLNNLNITNDTRKSKSFEEREEQYEKIRARIFNQSNKDDIKENTKELSKIKENLNVQKLTLSKISDKENNINNFDKKKDLFISKDNLKSDSLNIKTEPENQYLLQNNKNIKTGNDLNSNQNFYFTGTSVLSNINSFSISDNEIVENINDKKNLKINNLDSEEEIKASNCTSSLKSSKNFLNYNLDQYNVVKKLTNNEKTLQFIKNPNNAKSKNSKIFKNFNKNVQVNQNNLHPKSKNNCLDPNQARYSNWFPNSELQDSYKNSNYQHSMPYANYLSQHNTQKPPLIYNVSKNNSFGNEKMVLPSHVLQSSNMNQTQLNNNNIKNSSFGKENVNGMLTSPLSALSIAPLNPKFNDVNQLSAIPVFYLKPFFYPNTGTNTLLGDVLLSNNISRTQFPNQTQSGQMIMVSEFNTPINNFIQSNTLIPTPSINLINNQTYVPPTNFGYSFNNASTSHLELNPVYPQVSSSYIVQNSGIWPQQSPLLPTPLASTRIQKPISNYYSNNLNKPKKKLETVNFKILINNFPKIFENNFFILLDDKFVDLLNIDQTKKKINTNKLIIENIGNNLKNNKSFQHHVYSNSESKLINNT